MSCNFYLPYLHVSRAFSRNLQISFKLTMLAGGALGV